MRILLDQNAPIGLRTLLSDHDVRTAYEMGWAALSNGELLGAAETAGVTVLVTCDQNIQAQQNLRGRKIGLVVLGSNRWLTIQEHAREIDAAIARAGEGTYELIRMQHRLPRSPRFDPEPR